MGKALIWFWGAALAAQTFSIQTLAGTNAPAENVAAVQAPFASIEGIAVDGAGNIYVADAGDHRVRRITASGVIQTVAGDGVAGMSGDGGPARTARLNSPYGLAVDRAGNLFIADLGNARVRRVGLDGRITTVAGGGTAALPAGMVGVRGGEAKLQAPRNVAVDGQGQVWITDFDDHRLLRLAADGWLYTAVSVGLKNPTAMAFDRAGTLYVADAGNTRIVKLLGGQLVPATSTGAFSSQVLFYAITGLAIDVDGNLFAMEGGVRNLRRISPRNEIVEYSWAGRDVAVDAQKRIFLAGGGTVRRMSNLGVDVVAGGGDHRYAGDQGAADQARLNSPSAIARDVQGNLYIADTLNHRVRRVAAAGGAITTIAGTGEPGYSGDGGLAVQARLRSPAGIAVDGRGYVYIADTANHAVRRITPGGVMESVVGNGAPGRTFTQVNRPMGMAFDAQGTLIVADSGNGRIVQAGIGNTVRVLAQGAEGVGLRRPVDVAMDPGGRWIFIADVEAKKLFRLTSERLETIESDRLFEPAAVAVDPVDGSLIVGDTIRQQVVRVGMDSSFGILAGTGVAGFNGDRQAAMEADLNRPSDVLVAANGEILVADTDNHRIRRLARVAAPLPPEILPNDSVTVRGWVSQADGQPVGLLVAAALVALRGSGFRNPEVRFDGVVAPLMAWTPEEIRLQVPLELANRVRTEMELRIQGTVRYQQTVTLAEAALVVFTQPDGSAVALNQDQTINTPANPAAPGEVVTVYATGTGLWRGPGGGAAWFGAEAAEILWAGPAPGLAGVAQWNLRIPGAVGPGQVGVRVGIGGFAPSSAAPISVR